MSMYLVTYKLIKSVCMLQTNDVLYINTILVLVCMFNKY